VTIRSGSTRTVDLTCEFIHRSSGSGVTSGFSQALWIPVGEILIQREPLDRGRLPAVDLIQGETSESGDHRGRGMVDWLFARVPKVGS
jgi:hypothetical protein